MDIKFTSRHFHIDDRVREFAEGKLGKLEKFLEEPVEVHLTLANEKNRQIAELHVHHRHGTLDAAEEAGQIFDAIHAAVEKAEKQARRSRKKHQSKIRRGSRGEEAHHHWPMSVLDSGTMDAPEGPRVVSTSEIPIKPMTIDEAALALTASKNEFYVFRDSANDQVTVLYRRNDGNYGLISPEL